MPTRQEMWDRLGGDVDVLIVGGGITGTGIARDAAMRGLKVQLCEARDFAFGTSSRSSTAELATRARRSAASGEPSSRSMRIARIRLSGSSMSG